MARDLRAGHDKAEDGIRVPEVYRSVLRQACKREIEETDESCNPADWLLASDDPKKLAEWDCRVAALADQLFDERVGAGKPVIAWWYWLPLPLPAPLDRVGRADGPRRLLVTVDDYVTLIPKY